MAMRKELFEKIGPFDESYKGGYDEVDFLWRLCLVGYKIACEPNALVYHFHRTSFKGLIKQIFNYGKGCGRFCRKFPDAPLSRIRQMSLFAGLILAMIILTSLTLSLIIHSWFMYLPLMTIVLPMVPSIRHCIVLLFKLNNNYACKRISCLFYPFIDFVIYGIAYHLGMFFGILLYKK